MLRRLQFVVIILVAGFALGIAPVQCEQKQIQIEGEFTYLSWVNEDTSHTMSVFRLTSAPKESLRIYFDVESRAGEKASYSYSQDVSYTSPHAVNGLTLQRFDLTQLDSDKVYYFTLLAADDTVGKEEKFRLVPDDGSAFYLVQGGDLDASPHLDIVSSGAMGFEPRAVLLGGDIAYDNGDAARGEKWAAWFEELQTVTKTPQGFMVPMIVAIGNHEVNDKWWASAEERAPTYFGYFDQASGKTYFRRELGQDTALLVLDTGHISSHGGAQKEWLEKELGQLTNYQHRLALYHIPLYPSHRDYNSSHSRAGRTHWLELFDRFQLTVALENHEHTLKRSKPLRDGKVDISGTYYLGDGSWGLQRPLPDQEWPWYVDYAKSENHVWLVRVSPRQMQFRAMNGEAILDGLDIAN